MSGETEWHAVPFLRRNVRQTAHRHQEINIGCRIDDGEHQREHGDAKPHGDVVEHEKADPAAEAVEQEGQVESSVEGAELVVRVRVGQVLRQDVGDGEHLRGGDLHGVLEVVENPERGEGAGGGFREV